MHTTHAIVATKLASKYLQQLCKHFSHKVAVEFNSETARVDFPFGLCFMLAGTDNLSFFVQSSEIPAMMRARAVIDDHLLRFGFRESLVIDWQDTLPDPLPVDKLPDLKDWT